MRDFRAVAATCLLWCAPLANADTIAKSPNDDAAGIYDNQRVVAIISVYVNPERRADFEKAYRQRYQDPKVIEGLQEMSLLVPMPDQPRTPYKHVTYWKDLASFEKFKDVWYRNEVRGDHAEAGHRASMSIHDGETRQITTRDPVIEVFYAPVRKITPSTKGDQ
ncbi:hypothetical protein WL02_30935 [Burkholderia ubonensis]|uniref:ABM domain-containing protein n=2 Tax=Burkholderia ubonensis TaxID=101571 RepID=A0AAW3MUM5_9BURK|nr:hypothetical protein WJ45_33440 [Burkholderia ubonensis]KVO42615.1 hypothetical protein WJ75_04665 [Burkholderia ubonensis]KVP94071.1 hypothetical protein WJ96_13015 [Burkholderia ubonensis]KVQ49535.1 hypothetical protein WK04_07020 [Burkholderia ubonensis]KVX25290.1 hypothetical protein WL02_30935 [Burkholderia ubonensis]